MSRFHTLFESISNPFAASCRRNRNALPRWSAGLLGLALALAACGVSTAADPPAPEQAWQALPRYEHGRDIAPLLALDREVIRAMKTPEQRAACAAKFAAVLASPQATAAARQYAGLQLRQVGTSAEVPLLVRLLDDATVGDTARLALETIPGEAATTALRNALKTQKGDRLIGTIHSTATRGDLQAVPQLIAFADGADAKLADAAVRALGTLGGNEAATYLLRRAEGSTQTPPAAALAMLRCAEACRKAGNVAQAEAIYARLSRPGERSPARRAALDGRLQLHGDRAAATVLAWFASDDADAWMTAAARIHSLPDSQLDSLAARWAELPEASRTVLFGVLERRRGTRALTLAVEAAKSSKPEARLVGIRTLGTLGDPSVIGLLLGCLEEGGKPADEAQSALTRLPRKDVCDALLLALRTREKARTRAAAVLKSLKCYEAIDPLIVIVEERKPDVASAAIDALKGIADPDDADISRLVSLYLRLPQGDLRDELERAVAVVCHRLPEASRAEPVLKVVASRPASERPKYLPLLGRLGGKKVAAMIDADMPSNDPAVKASAIAALCNWPSIEVTERLWGMASQSPDAATGQAALRAYVRLVSLRGNRPDAETLPLLQKAMKLAAAPESKQWILTRAAAVRTVETVDWLAGYLDDAALNQVAAKSIVELAHHRFLRHPNMAKFGPLLEKVEKTSQDRTIVERARKYRLGL